VVRPPYGVAARLTFVARQRWAEIDGDYARQSGGQSPFGLRWDRLLNVIYTWAVERVEDRDAFDAYLEASAEEGGRGTPSAATLAAEGQAFMDFMAAVNG